MRTDIRGHLDLKSVVLDISRLKIGEQLVFLDLLCEHLFKKRVDQAYPKQTMLIIEECSTFIKNLRSETAQNVYRLAFTGRNMSIRLTYIDPRLNSIPAEFRFLAGQNFIGYANEVNILNKVKRLYGKEWEKTVKTLNVGEFIRVQATKNPELIRVPLFTPNSKPVEITETLPQTTYTSQTQATHTQIQSKFNGSWWFTFLSTLAIFMLFWSQVMQL